VITLVYGVVQGVGAELVFAAFAYRAWGWIVAIIAGLGSGLALGILDLTLYYAAANSTFFLIYLVSSVASGAVLGGLLSWTIARALARAGALRK
jgi:energy-coupling factor transport system substrate-specific component